MACRKACWTGWTGVALILTALACATPPPPPPPVEVNTGQDFSSERAWQHLVALSAIGPRVAGTDGAKQARDYIRQQLQEMGLEATSQTATIERPSGSLTLENLIVTIPGASPDLFLLSTHYDTHPMPDFALVGANEGASGVAVLLELARVYAAKPLPYTVQISFTDGDVLAGEEAKTLSELLPGSSAWVKWLKDQGLLKSARFALMLDQVGDRDLAFARDLFSNRAHRETFWRTAHELGYQGAFPPTASFESVGMGHRLLDAEGMRASIALADTHYGDGEIPGKFWRTANDVPENNSQASLEITGRVSLVAMEKIAQRLQRIDSLMVRRSGPTQERVAPASAQMAPEPTAAPAPAPAASGATEVEASQSQTPSTESSSATEASATDAATTSDAETASQLALPQDEGEAAAPAP